jgi:hypothetical protein
MPLDNCIKKLHIINSRSAMVLIKRLLSIPLFLLLIGVFLAPKAHAASLIDVSDDVTTSRPSAAATLSASLAVGATAAVIGDRGDMYLASDSAILYPEVGESFAALTVASQSASGVPIPSQKLVYFTTAAGASHHAGEALIVPITATHVVQFTTNAAIPGAGHIILTFPTVANNIASPSATGFSFNGLITANMSTFIQCNPAAACGGAGQTISGNTITLTTTGAVSGMVVVAIGCKTSVSAGGICANPTALLINPTVSSTQCVGVTCTAGNSNGNDIWKIGIQTTDASNGYLDSGKASVATIESVQVQAQVEPTMTFAITGLTNAQNYNTVGGSQCGSEASNTGIDSTATSVNLGILNASQVSKAGQSLTVTTNQAFGYDIQATSSGHFINAASGIALPDANGGNGLTSNILPAPAAMAAGTAAFGISPCGIDVPTSNPNWGGAGTITGGTALLANPWNTPGNMYAMTLATYTGGPSAGSNTTHGVTVVRYAAAISTTTASGLYTTTLTYTATPSF